MPQSFSDFVEEQKKQTTTGVSFHDFVQNQISQPTTGELKYEKPDPYTQARIAGVEATQTYGGIPKGLYPYTSLLERAAGGISGGISELGGKLEKTRKYMVKKLGIPKSVEEFRLIGKPSKQNIFEQMQEKRGKWAEYWKMKGAKGVAGETMAGLGGAAESIAEIMSLGKLGLPIHGALSGLVEGGAKGAAVGGLKGALMHGIIGGLGKLPTGTRLPAWFTVGAATTPGGIEERTAGGLTFAVLGLTGGSKKISMKEFISNYPKIEAKLGERNAKYVMKKFFPDTSKEQLKQAGGAKPVLEEVIKEVEKPIPIKPIVKKVTPPIEVEKQMEKGVEPVVDVAKEVKAETKDLELKYAGIPISQQTIKQLGETTKATKLARKVVDTLLVEPQFKRIGAPDTGLAFKRFSGIQEHEWEQSKIKIKKVIKAMPDGKARQNLTWMAERPGIFKREFERGTYKKEMSVAYHEMRNFYNDYQAKLKEAGIPAEWPGSMIASLREENSHLTNSLKRPKLDSARRDTMKAQIKDNLEIIKFLTSKKIQYVGIPKFWLESWFESERETGRDVPSIITQFFHERKTKSIEELAGWLTGRKIIKPEDTDAAIVMASYAHQVGRKLALAEIFNTAKREGLIKDPEKAPPEWQFLSFKEFPTIRGKKVHPVLAHYFENNLIKMKFLPPQLGAVLGTVKMLQFYNPIFLPMYDVYQAWWAGSVRSRKTPVFIQKAFKSMFQKDQAYWDMHYWGGFSTPFTPSYKNHMAEAKDWIAKNPLLKTIAKKALFPVPLMRASWTAAWTGDHFIRMITYHHYLNEGLSPKEAAQLTATDHADYAGIPTRTRKWVNPIIFTPSFKIAMTAAQTEMVTSAGKLLIRAAKGKAGQPINPREKYMAKALLGLVSGMAIRHFFFRALGFKTDRFGLRYSKSITTDEGEKKELVIHAASPDNVIQRMYHRASNIWTSVKDGDINQTINSAKWDLHPMWQLAIEQWSNKGTDFEPISNSFDSWDKIAKDRTVYSIQRILRYTEQLTGPGAKRREAQRALKKDLGKFAGEVLKWFVLPYTRSPAEKRVQYQILRLKSTFLRTSREKPAKSEKELDNRVKKFQDELRDILKELEK